VCRRCRSARGSPRARPPSSSAARPCRCSSSRLLTSAVIVSSCPRESSVSVRRAFVVEVGA
jgi:hypothetical protein